MREIICSLAAFVGFLGFVAFVFGCMAGLTYPYPAWTKNYIWGGFIAMGGCVIVLIYELITWIISFWR